MEPTGEKDIQYWTEQFIRGQKGSLSYFFGQHYQPLVYFAYRLTQNETEAEDIVADCFTKLWEKREGFKTAENIKAYLYISCRNVCLTYLRNLKRKTAAQKLYFEQLEKSGNNILNEIVEAEFLQILDQEINLLPAKCREVFNLIYFEGKKTDEIALQLDLSVKTVRNHKARAVELLKTTFLKKGVNSPLYLAFLFFLHKI